jgi:hypothetical protein
MTFFFVGLEFELGFMLAKQVLLSFEAHLQSIFALVILEIGSCKLFAWIGLKPQSSQSQPP